jgi:hypothetical protein
VCNDRIFDQIDSGHRPHDIRREKASRAATPKDPDFFSYVDPEKYRAERAGAWLPFANAVRQLRRRCATKTEFCNRVGISLTSLAKYEDGRGTPRPDILERLKKIALEEGVKIPEPPPLPPNPALWKADRYA